ncbi:E3 ubiquitin-protein ligase [Thalictrum thalictroides]|uniref:RING-type E3 ubiquitin transferase n=1 Tax=Thalictrum thalictroides TaxID=46969 RepID=A0A7J6VZZ7_THATH|nr:E3 ubiquitin-protein ligase [Thalictrum thalictroides]
MGNSCSNQNVSYHHQTKPSSGNASAVHRRPSSSVAPSGNRSGNTQMSSTRDVGFNQRTQGGRLIRPSKIQTVHTEDQQIPSVTNPARANQTDEPHTPCKSQKLPTEDQQIATVTTAATANQTDEPHMSCKSPKVPNEDQQIAPVTTAVTANQTDEPHTSCNSPKVPNEDQQIAPVTTAVTANQTDEPHTSCNSPKVPNEDQLSAPVTTAATANQADEPLILKSNEDIIATSCCKFEADDASKELEKTSTNDDDDEDECPTCLEGYDEENPKIMTECNHHYHLACIFEWMERSDTCPVCNKVMIFNN